MHFEFRFYRITYSLLNVIKFKLLLHQMDNKMFFRIKFSIKLYLNLQVFNNFFSNFPRFKLLKLPTLIQFDYPNNANKDIYSSLNNHTQLRRKEQDPLNRNSSPRVIECIFFLLTVIEKLNII